MSDAYAPFEPVSAKAQLGELTRRRWRAGLAYGMTLHSGGSCCDAYDAAGRAYGPAEPGEVERAVARCSLERSFWDRAGRLARRKETSTMCGRFALYEPEWRMVWERLNGGHPNPVKPTKPDEGELRPGWNISPMQRTACVLAKGEEIKGALALWSLVPPWHKGPLEQKRYATFNAKSEEILQKPAFKGAMQKHRCLVPANLFYEWKKDGKEKQPYAIGMKDESLFAFAGVWTYWRGTWKEEPFEDFTFTILTTSSNPLMEKIHNRMPVIVPRESYMTWLTAPAEEALKLTAPFPSQLMTAWPVGKEVGNVRNQGPDLARPVSSNA